MLENQIASINSSVSNEIWKDVVGHEGEYQVSDFGRVKSLGVFKTIRGIWNRHTGKIIKGTIDKKGYVATELSIKEKKRKSYFVHRLVLEAFVGFRPEGYECRHLDGNPANNRLENICWGTPQENADDRNKHGSSRVGCERLDSRGIDNPSCKMNEEKVRLLRKLWDLGEKSNKYLVHLSTFFGLSRSGTRAIVSRRTWKWLED